MAVSMSLAWIIRVAVAAALGVAAAGCVSHRVEVHPVMPTDRMVVVGPVKVHLRDGSTVVYAPGVAVSVTAGALRGAGTRYNYALTEATPVDSVPVDMVAGMERFTTEVNRTATGVQSVAAGYAIGVVVLLVLLSVALQGH